MTARSHNRGHPTVYVDDEWRWADTLNICKDDRPCIRCGEMPTPEGYDACLGYVEGVTSACCGHGVNELIRL